MLTYEESMALGQAEYQDVLDALAAAGWVATFTQTGGMNAALEVWLDGGYSLLITDAEDSVAWSRAEHQGWTVALYAPQEQYDGTCLDYAITEDSSVEALEPLIRGVLKSAVRGHSAPAT